MSKNRKGVKDPVVEAGITIALLSFIFMIGYANPFNPLPFMVSIVGVIVGLYLIALRVALKKQRNGVNLSFKNLIFFSTGLRKAFRQQ